MELFELSAISTEAIRTLSILVLPTLAVPLAALVVAIVQSMLAIREESLQYGVRAIGIVVVLAIFGAQMFQAMVSLMIMALR